MGEMVSRVVTIFSDAFVPVIPFPQNRLEKYSGKTCEAVQWIRKFVRASFSGCPEISIFNGFPLPRE
jgi:hypothetical protein